MRRYINIAFLEVAKWCEVYHYVICRVVACGEAAVEPGELDALALEDVPHHPPHPHHGSLRGFRYIGQPFCFHRSYTGTLFNHLVGGGGGGSRQGVRYRYSVEVCKLMIMAFFLVSSSQKIKICIYAIEYADHSTSTPPSPPSPGFLGIFCILDNGHGPYVF